MAGEIKAADLLGEFGRAIFDAQNRLNREALERSPGPVGLPTTLSISETDLEVKLLFEEKATGAVVRPVSRSSAELRPEAFSMLRVKIIAVPEEEVRPPSRSPADVREEALARPDVARLKKIFGDLTALATYVPEARRWVVDVAEPGGAILRSLQVSDERGA